MNKKILLTAAIIAIISFGTTSSYFLKNNKPLPSPTFPQQREKKESKNNQPPKKEKTCELKKQQIIKELPWCLSWSAACLFGLIIAIAVFFAWNWKYSPEKNPMKKNVLLKKYYGKIGCVFIAIFTIIVLPLFFAKLIKNGKNYFSRFRKAFLNNLKIIPIFTIFFIWIILINCINDDCNSHPEPERERAELLKATKTVLKEVYPKNNKILNVKIAAEETGNIYARVESLENIDIIKVYKYEKKVPTKDDRRHYYSPFLDNLLKKKK